MDPITIGLAVASMAKGFYDSAQAKKSAAANQAYQEQNLANALSAARSGQASSLRAAGGLRLDQFGNATYYDPTQGRWITSFSPNQQDLITGGEERQRRAQVRGSQASQDYDTLRGEYLYKKPKTEAESYAELVNLINTAQGTGERQLNTLMDRWGVRTAGNLPQLVQRDNGPTPGQQLAETMLKARGAALDESLKRQAGHTSQYLPALKQFEDTANYVAPIDPTGSVIEGMQQQGQKDLLSSMSDYDKLISTLMVSGGRNVGSAFDSATKAATSGPGTSDFMSIAKALTQKQDPKGTLGNTKGATYSGGGAGSGSGGSDDSLGNFDHRYNYFMSNDPEKGAGTEPAPFGGAAAELGYKDYVAPNYLAVPNYGDTAFFGGGDSVNYSGGAYATPWSF
jgi:hypothetical protein